MSESLPFEHLFRPLVLDAAGELRRQVGQSAYGLLTPEAHAAWGEYLLSRLAAAGAKAAHWQFQIYQTVRSIFPAEGLGEDQANDASYHRFVGARPQVRLGKLFKEFPALEEFCTVLTKNWFATVTEFLTRLQADHGELSSHFWDQHFPLPVPIVQAGLGDPHRGGRCVLRLSFQNGVSLIYKPRSLAPEILFAKLLHQLNEGDIPHTLRAARCWDCGEYGWMENVDRYPCESSADVHTFYWRTGTLLGLVHLARGVDFHYENLIAAGEHPVLIDLETLWHPQDHNGTRTSDNTFAIRRTGFLPFRGPSAETDYFQSALSRSENPEMITDPWTRINQDGTARKLKIRTDRRRSNLPTCNDQIYSATGFVRDIRAGFAWIGEHLLDAGPQQAKFERWLTDLIGCTRRRVHRSSTHYRFIASRLTSQEILRSERLAPAFRTEITRCLKSARKTEIHALGQGDIPYLKQVNRGSANSQDVAGWLPPQEIYLKALAEIAAAFEGTVAPDH